MRRSSVRGTTASIAGLLVVYAAGCGSGSAPPTGSRSSQTLTQARPALTPRQRREVARLRADLRRLKIAAAPVHHSMMGTPKLMTATGTFLDDEEHASLDNLTKNRMIDLAASAVAGSCDQCVQQLEANRPLAGSMKTH